jgi:hypothetical protein
LCCTHVIIQIRHWVQRHSLTYLIILRCSSNNELHFPCISLCLPAWKVIEAIKIIVLSLSFNNLIKCLHLLFLFFCYWSCFTRSRSMSSGTTLALDFAQLQFISQCVSTAFGFLILAFGVKGNLLNILHSLYWGNYKHNASSLYILAKIIFWFI